MENTSTLQKAIETVEALSPEEQMILIDIIQNRLREQKRQELLQDVAEAEQHYLSGNFKRGSVADLMAELDQWEIYNPQLRTLIEQRLQQLSENPFHPSLRSHKLKGGLSGIWSCYIDYSYRILFKFTREQGRQEDDILLLTLGSHDEVY